LVYNKQYHQLYYKKNKQRINSRNKKYYEKNKVNANQYKKEWYLENSERIKYNRKIEHSNLRYLILLYYSYDIKPECSCCKEPIKEFLILDHINNWNSCFQKFDNIRAGVMLYKWLLKNNFPFEDELQILCYNCNFSKRNKKECIHKRKIPLNPLTKNQKYYSKLKYETMKYYSNTVSCKCCGENELEFLSIDHINGKGKIQRERTGGNGNKFYRWLKKNNYPKLDLQILCMNCNSALGHYKFCPHK